MKILKTLLLLVVMGLTGCTATFIEKGVSEPKAVDVSQYKEKPNVYIVSKAVNGSPHRTISAAASPEVVQNRISYLLNKSNIFNSYRFTEEPVSNQDELGLGGKREKQDIDYKIGIIIYNNYNKDWTDWVSLIEVFSLGLIPLPYQQEYIVKMDVYDKEDNLIITRQNNLIANNWIGLWFLPFEFTKYEHSNFERLLDIQVDTFFKDFVREGVFKYR